jgi:endonuclease/exonuclease/phosphatase (EEP) superfamily protein YafD
MSEKPAHSRFGLRGFCIAYIVILLVVLIALEWWAEYFLPLWFLIFAPPIVLLLPVPFLAIGAIRSRSPRCLLALAACVLVVAFVFSRYRFNFSPDSKEKPLTVITHNIGEGNPRAFHESFAVEKADAILLQDAFRPHELAFTRRYPDLRARSVAQFMLLSRHEITEAALVNTALWRGRPVAARYVIRTPERSIALYNVHLPTPRRSLNHAFSGKVVQEMFWMGNAPTDDYPSYRAWLSARVALARQLAEIFARERLPFLVGGDFNTPDHGVVYRIFSGQLTDAHTHAGRGWGFTFPGARDGKLAQSLGPWLRLDYLFAGPNWQAVECRVASDPTSQHRAVLARFLPKP